METSIEGIQYTGSNLTELGSTFGWHFECANAERDGDLIVQTESGERVARKGDWIIRYPGEHNVDVMSDKLYRHCNFLALQ